MPGAALSTPCQPEQTLSLLRAGPPREAKGDSLLLPEMWLFSFDFAAFFIYKDLGIQVKGWLYPASQHLMRNQQHVNKVGLGSFLSYSHQ